MNKLMASCQLFGCGSPRLCGELLQITESPDISGSYSVQIDIGHHVITVSNLDAKAVEIFTRDIKRH